MDKNVLKLCGNTASVLALIQAVIWGTFHMLDILSYQEVIQYNISKDNSSSTLLGDAIYQLFVNPNRKPILGLYMHPQILFIVNCVYLAGSIVWMGSSSFLCWVSFRGKWRLAFKYILSWVLITSILSIGDLVMIAFLSVDFMNFYNKIDNISYNMAFIVAILITSRVVLLWITNVCFVIYFIRVLAKKGYEDLEKFKDGCLDRNRPIEAWNEEPALNQQELREEPNFSPEDENFDRGFYENPGYEPDETTSYFSTSVKSVSVHIRRPKRVVYPVPPPRLPSSEAPYTAPPRIPPPDYTPPGSPTFNRSPVYKSTTEFHALKY